MIKNNGILILIGALYAFFSSLSEAADLGAIAEVGVGNSDNIARTSSNEIDEDIITAGLNVSFAEASKNITADILGRVIRFDYQGNTFEDETLASVNAQLQFGSSDSLFNWMVQNNYGQQLIDVFTPATPNNRENVNAFATGPGIHLPIGQRTSFDAGVYYTDVNYEIRPQDNQRTGARLQLLRRATQIRSFALVLNGLQIEFDDQTVNEDVDLLQAFGRYQVSAARTTATIDLGWNEIDSAVTSSGGLLADVTIDRQTSPFGNFALRFVSRFSDASDIFGQFQQFANRGISLFGDDVTSDVENTSDPLQLTFASINYNVKRDRTTWGLGAAYRDEQFETEIQRDRTLTTYKLDLSRRITPNIQLVIYGSFTKREFDGRNRDDEDVGYGGGVAWSPGRRLTMSLNLDQLDRSSSDPAADYSETRVFLTFAYAILETAPGQ